ncbi:MAG: chemotaxis protein CheW [Woeseiaceae bacterium]|nr:chemotaxis protein CheW [Woeseiaceae bacterium]
MSTVAEELYSLLVPLDGERLIVPRACVAEVVRFTRPEEREGSADWLLGSVSWSGRDLPVVAFEGVINRGIPDITGRTRIVVFHADSRKLPVGCFGVLTQGFPQLVRVNREVLKLDTRRDGWAEDAPVLCRVKMINEYPLIPHLEKLEGQIADEVTQA